MISENVSGRRRKTQPGKTQMLGLKSPFGRGLCIIHSLVLSTSLRVGHFGGGKLNGDFCSILPCTISSECYDIGRHMRVFSGKQSLLVGFKSKSAYSLYYYITFIQF